MLTPASILITTVLLSLAMVLVLGSLLRAEMAGVREWFTSNLAVIGGLLLLGLRGLVPDFFSIVAANLVLALSTACYYAGCARFLGRPPHWLRLAAGIGALALALTIWLYIDDNIPLRVLATTTYTGIVCVAVAVLLLRHRPSTRRRYNYWFAAALALIFALCQVARGIHFIMLPLPSDPLIFHSTWNMALLIVGAVIMPAMTMVAVMMIHDAMLAAAEDAANHDHMTGALSRKRLETLAREQIANAVKAGRPLSLLIIDLDHFKHINDNHGHAGGDTVLREFVRMTRASLRDSDALGRMGGEEFAVLLPDTDTAGALRIAERLREQTKMQLVIGAFGECRYSISAGVASWRTGETFDRLSMRADRALYTAKSAGRNRVLPDDVQAVDQAMPATV
ncbi:diguanylate cyclase domain protein [Collimonas arenae]|uniref:diguanylate cyclase n=1 Tax=Collimonas arenae TaxID=279058 RepID=A0A127PNV5_9BURK|nr:GGDEF domain-containing protein [Collimonas arenae]AMO99486.1 diguanylate cyclase domain protein [Collimonas arenae]AMP09386.1 diguanylate cyclase domain protein [Collimonas arenae]